MLQKRPYHRESTQKLHNGAEKVTEKQKNAHAFDNETNERVFGQNQEDSSEEEECGLDFRWPGKEIDRARRPNDKNNANHK